VGEEGVARLGEPSWPEGGRPPISVVKICRRWPTGYARGLFAFWLL